MASTRRTHDLTRKECIDLLGERRAGVVASVSIGEAAPVRLVCFPLPDGDVVIPTGHDRDLVSVATDRPVTIQFEHFDPDARRGWVVHGSGVARPISRRERPPARTHTALAMRYAFENGIHLSIGKLAGFTAR